MSDISMQQMYSLRDDLKLLYQCEAYPEQVDWEKAFWEIPSLRRYVPEGMYNAGNPLPAETLRAIIEGTEKRYLYLLAEGGAIAEIRETARRELEDGEMPEEDRKEIEHLKDKVFDIDMAEHIEPEEWKEKFDLIEKQDEIVRKNKRICEGIRRD